MKQSLPFLKLIGVGLVSIMSTGVLGIATTSTALLVPKAAQAQPAPTMTSQKVKAALPQLQTLAEQTQKKTGVPGMAIAVVYKDQVVYLKGFGVREAGKNQLVNPDTVFQLASVSKPIASTIVAGVIGDGLVKWDDPLTKHDPGFEMDNAYATREVTLRDMFAHRSGLPDHGGDLLEDMGFDRATILYRLRYLPTYDNFRSQYAYTNYGLTEAAVAAAKATGKSWENLAADKLYRPLGMKYTSSRYADFLAAKNRALGHVSINGKWVAKYKRDPQTQSPAGGVSSTVRDLSQWMRLQLSNGKFAGRQIIDANALAETHRPQMVSNPPQNPSTDRAGFYGLGWNVSYTNQGLVQLSHSGAFSLGAATAVYMLPSESLGIVVLTNAYPIGVPESIALSFLDLVQTGKIQKNWLEIVKPLFAAMSQPPYGTEVNYAKSPARRSPALPNTTYVGTYRNDFFGEIEIIANGGKLILQQGPKNSVFPLQHYDRDVFTYQPVGESAYGLSGVTFEVGPNQRAMNVVIENLDIHGQGTFTRVPDKP